MQRIIIKKTRKGNNCSDISVKAGRFGLLKQHRTGHCTRHGLVHLCSPFNSPKSHIFVGKGMKSVINVAVKLCLQCNVTLTAVPPFGPFSFLSVSALPEAAPT